MNMLEVIVGKFVSLECCVLVPSTDKKHHRSHAHVPFISFLLVSIRYAGRHRGTHEQAHTHEQPTVQQNTIEPSYTQHAYRRF